MQSPSLPRFCFLVWASSSPKYYQQTLVKQANKDNLPNFLMLEDDVVFSEELRNLDKYMSNIPDDWDMIYFGGNHKYSHPPQQINETTLKLHYTVAIHCVAIKSTVYDVTAFILVFSGVHDTPLIPME